LAANDPTGAAYPESVAAPFATQTITPPAAVRRRKGVLYWLLPAVSVLVAAVLAFAIVNADPGGPAAKRIGGDELGWVTIGESRWTELANFDDMFKGLSVDAQVWSQGKYDRIWLAGYGPLPGHMDPGGLLRSALIAISGGAPVETTEETFAGRPAWHGSVVAEPSQVAPTQIRLEAWIVIAPNGDAFWVSAESDNPKSEVFQIIRTYRLPDGVSNAT
jgi:hypothetical protein